MLFECSRRKPEKLSRIRRSKIFRSGKRVEIRIRVHLSPAFRMGQGGQQWLSARRRADWRSAAAQRESRSSGGVIISPWTSGGVAVDIESANKHRSAACGPSPVDGEDATYVRSPTSRAGFVSFRSIGRASCRGRVCQYV